MNPKINDKFDFNTAGKPDNSNPSFDAALREYLTVLEDLKQRTIDKYGIEKVKLMYPKWFKI